MGQIELLEMKETILGVAQVPIIVNNSTRGVGAFPMRQPGHKRQI